MNPPGRHAADVRSKRVPQLDPALIEMGLRMTPAQRLRWLEETVEELLPWLGLASRPAGDAVRGK